MESASYVQNFGGCQLGDLRLNRRALSIGEALSQKFGQALSTVFEDANELKRAYEFSPIPKPPLKRSSVRTAR
ncbi:MAG: transposase DNA-binding-containing protein [Leptolyngbyaceae cyanobacterium MO_188.B28]|nr:transposase DNA-binding-containing protein [Leptolyngbyaceae cyanobacterium MO_188.B28]